MDRRIKISIPIQSISDIITNSSSELFCTIHSDNNLLPIYELVERLFPDDDPDYRPSIYWMNGDEIVSPYDETQSDPYIEIYIPYSFYNLETFFKGGLEAVLNQSFGEDYKIEFN